MLAHRFQIMALLLPLAMFAGCENDGSTADAEVSSTSGDGDGTGDGDGDGDGTGDGDGDDTWEEQGCSYALGDHSSACEGPDCAILTDIQIDCDDETFANHGIRVAETNAGPLLVAGSPNNTYMFQAQGETIARLEDVPYSIVGEHVLVATTPEGEPGLLIDASGARTEGAPSGLLYLWQGAEGWEDEVVIDRGEESLVAIDLEYAADGTAHAWFFDTELASGDYAVRTGPGSWSVEDTSEFIQYDTPHYTLTLDGERVQYSYLSENLDAQLQRTVSGATMDIGPLQQVNGYTRDMMAVESPMPSGQASGPSDAVMSFDVDGVRLLWPDDQGGWGALLLEDTQVPPWACLPAFDEPCLPDECHELGQGVNEGNINAARTADGTIWLVWVEDRYDIRMTFYESCTEGICACLSDFIEDNTTHVLHLARFDGVSAAEEVLTMDLPATQGAGVALGFGGLGDDLLWSVDARAYGDRLALGLRLKLSPGIYGKDRVLRVMEIDTSLLD